MVTTLALRTTGENNMVTAPKSFWDNPDRFYKLAQIALLIGMAGAFYGQARTVAAATASHEMRISAIERQTAETAAITKQTADILTTLVANLRAHEIEDAAITAIVEQDNARLNALTGRGK